MPISKDKVLESVKKDYSQVYEIIDRLLLEKADDLFSDYNKRIIIYTKDLEKFTYGHIEIIIKEYEKHGWKVSYHSYQKDGDWLEFK